MRWNVDFSAVVSVLSNLTAAEVNEVKAAYSKHENKRSLEEDLFGKGASGFESNLSEVQRAQIRALLAGTRAGRTAEKQAAATHVASAQAAEMHRLLRGDQSKADVERMMTILRQGQAANAALNAAYTRLTGTTLEIGRMRPLDMMRASMLLAGNVVAADACKVSTLKGRITGIDEDIAKLEDVSRASPLGSLGGVWQIKHLREERKKLVGEIAQRGEQAAAEAQATGESVKARVGAVLGDAGALATQVRGPDAAVIRAIAEDDPAAKVAAQLRKAREAGELSAEKLATALRGLRAEAEKRARQMLPSGGPRVEAEATRLADEYFAKLRIQYNALVPKGGDMFETIVKETGDEGDENLNKALWVGAGRLADVEELVLALRGGRKDTEAVERVLRNKSAMEIQILKVQYMGRTGGRSLDFDLFGLAPTTAGEENPQLIGGAYLKSQGKAEGTSRLNLEDYMQRPNVEGGIDEMWYIVARAEREYAYTIENRGVTGWWRDAWGNEQRTLLNETLAELHRLQTAYLRMVGWVPHTGYLLRPEAAKSQDAKKILQEMRLARHTIRGDRAAYEKATAELRATFQAIASFVIQAALTALLTPAVGALFKGAMAARGVMAARMIKWVETVSVNAVSSVGGNLMVHGPDYSLAMLKADLLGGLGGQLGSDAVGKMLGPVAKGLAQRLGPKCSAEIISFAKGIGNIEGGAWAQGMEGDLSLQNIVQTHLMGKGSEVITQGVSSVTGQAPKPPATALGGGEPVPPAAETAPPTAETAPAEQRGKTGSAPDASGVEPRPPTAEVHHEPKAPKPPTSGAELDASVEQSSHKENNEITDKQAVDEVAYIDKHPEIPVEGTPPNQRATLGDHEIVEVAGGGCERHSGAGRSVVCPIRMGVNAHASAIEKNLDTIPAELRSPTAQALKEARAIARTNPAKAQRVLDALEARLRTEGVGSVLDAETRRTIEGAERLPDQGFEESSRTLSADDLREFARSARPLPTVEERLLLQDVVDNVSTRLLLDPAEAARFLSPKELATSSMTAANFGKAVERAVALELADDPALARFLHTPQRPGVATPDIGGPIGRTRPRVYDITTPRGIREHDTRPYASFMKYVTYPTLPPGWRFPPP